MRALPVLLAPALLLPALLAGGAARARDDVPYRRYNFLHTGYSDKQVAPDVWRVKGSAHAMGDGVAVALYRAAELAMAAHADEVRVVNQKLNELTMSRRFTREIESFTETATVTVRFVRAPADRTACDAPDPRQCMTLAVAGVLARFGDRLGQPIARPGEAPARPVTLVTYDPKRGGLAPWSLDGARRWPEPVASPRPSPGLAMLLGRVVSSTRPGAAATTEASAAPAAALARDPVQALAPAPVAPRPIASQTPRLSAAEVERARLEAAAALAEGGAGGGVTVR